jgi:hypothetical protein
VDGPAPGGDLGTRFGPYFALEIVPVPPCDWEPVADLGDPSTGSLARRVAAVRAALAASRSVPAGQVEERVAVSVTQLGVCARLVAPALALTVVTGEAPRIDRSRLYWRDVLGGPFPLAVVGPLALTTPPSVAVPPDRLARDFTERVLVPVIGPLVAVAATWPVSRWVLWGNVASGVAGAAKMIGIVEPRLAGAAWGLLDALCAGDGPLGGAGGRDAPARFRRRSCCLIYRLEHGPARALCEDCVLALTEPGSRRRQSRRP